MIDIRKWVTLLICRGYALIFYFIGIQGQPIPEKRISSGLSIIADKEVTVND